MKTIKNILMIICMLLTINVSAASDCDIRISVINAGQSDVPDGVQNILASRLMTAVAANGVTADISYGQFFITGKFQTISENVVPGPPTMTALSLQLTLYIADIVGQQVYASKTFELRGVGTSRERAYINALQSINAENSKLTSFVEDAKTKIVNYYDRNYTSILAKAKTAAGKQSYDEALYLTTQIPECSTGYAKASEATLKYYNQYINLEADQLILAAEAAWASSPDEAGAELAMSYLSQVNTTSKSYSKAQSLIKTISAKVQRNWDFENRDKYNREMSVREREIDAARAIGVAYGNGQKPTTTNLMWLK